MITPVGGSREKPVPAKEGEEKKKDDKPPPVIKPSSGKKAPPSVDDIDEGSISGMLYNLFKDEEKEEMDRLARREAILRGEEQKGKTAPPSTPEKKKENKGLMDKIILDEDELKKEIDELLKERDERRKGRISRTDSIDKKN